MTHSFRGRALWVLLACLFVLALPGNASAKWTRLSFEHFIFVGDAPERQIRDIAQRLEQFRQTVGRLLSDDATNSPVPTVVVVFQNEKSFSPFKPAFQGRPVDVSGYFVGTEDVNYIAVNAEQDTDAYGLIFHEYAHFLIRNEVANAPQWVNEGLAELYETFTSTNGGKTAMIGTPSAQNLRLLQSASALLTIPQLIEVNSDSPLYNEGDRRSLFYAQSWALVHYLTFGNKERSGQLKAYLAAIGEGTPPADAFDQAFGPDRAALARSLAQYVQGARFNALRIELDEKLARTPAAPAETIPDHEASGYLGDMMARLNRTDDARAYLQRTIGAVPDAGRAMAALGLLELRATNDDLAFPLLERAAALSPSDPTVQSAYGRALTKRADRGGADEDALYSRARMALARALELQPDNVSTIVTLAEVEMASGANAPRAVRLMQQALKAAPGREEYRLMLAQALAMNGDYRGASEILGLLIDHGSRPEVSDAARRALTRVEEAEDAARGLALAAAAEPDAASTGSSAASRPNEPRRETAPQGVFVPTLRPVQAGESRVAGVFSSVDCSRPGVTVLLVDTADGALRLAIRSLADVEFLSYRPDAPRSVACGPQRPAYPVLATFRPDAPPLAGANTSNRVVAIELLPDGFGK